MKGNAKTVGGVLALCLAPVWGTALVLDPKQPTGARVAFGVGAALVTLGGMLLMGWGAVTQIGEELEEGYDETP